VAAISLAAAFGWLASSKLTVIQTGWSLEVSGLQITIVVVCTVVFGLLIAILGKRNLSWIESLVALPLVVSGLWVGTAIATGGLRHVPPVLAWTAIGISLVGYTTSVVAGFFPASGQLWSGRGFRLAVYLGGLFGVFLGPVFLGG
jgi:hypothetical protein